MHRRTDNIYSIFRDKLLLLGEHVIGTQHIKACNYCFIPKSINHMQVIKWLFCILFLLLAIIPNSNKVWSLFFQKKILEHSMPCLNNQWNGKVEILELLSCAIFRMLEWSIVFCFCWFEKDVNAFLSTLSFSSVCGIFYSSWTMQCKSFDHFSRLSLNIGLSPYSMNTWTNLNATQYWTTI